MKPKAWSYSALHSFNTCPRQYYEMNVAKNYPYVQGEEAKWGDMVHKALEDHVKGIKDVDTTNLPESIKFRFREILAEFKDYYLIAEGKVSLTKDLKECTFFAKNTWVRGIIDLLALEPCGDEAYVIDWKGLPLTTLIPTPTGFAAMEDICESDVVIGGDGRPCTVVGKSSIHKKKCLNIQFDDKSEVICDFDHRWLLTDGSIVDAYNLKICDRIKLTEPLQLPDQELLIDPYVLGFWLADGKHTSGEVTKPDAFIWDEVVRRGYNIGNDYYKDVKDKCRAHTIKGIRGHLKTLNVLGNKHIPKIYLRASYSQRLDLLRGLMDGDGSANSVRKQAVFTSCNKILSDNVKELLLSLGQRPNQATTTQTGFGLTVTAYPIAFRPIGLNPFLLPRKADRILHDWGSGNSWCRRVVSITEIKSVPTQCISVDSPDNTYLCTENFIVTHNTGKVKPDSKQLKLFALFTFYKYKDINTVHSRFEWLAYNDRSEDTYTREQIPDLWMEFIPDLNRFKEAFNKNKWPEKPSGLCSKWCDVLACKHNGRR